MFGCKGGAFTYVTIGIALSMLAAIIYGIVGFVVVNAIFITIAIKSDRKLKRSPEYVGSRLHYRNPVTENEVNDYYFRIYMIIKAFLWQEDCKTAVEKQVVVGKIMQNFSNVKVIPYWLTGIDFEKDLGKINDDNIIVRIIVETCDTKKRYTKYFKF